MGAIAYKNKDNKNELLRMATAGSLTTTFVDVKFHLIDTVNIRSKAETSSHGSGMLS